MDNTNIWNCGCGRGYEEADEDEIERIIREVEEDETPILIPTEPEGIPAPDVFIRVPKREKVLVE